jgi:hypothetical protein
MDWDEATSVIDADEKADAEYRVANLTARERTFVLALADTPEQQIARTGKLLVVQQSLDDKGWLRIRSDYEWMGDS